jgi:membrane-bound lytic murein transglycosylase D
MWRSRCDLLKSPISTMSASRIPRCLSSGANPMNSPLEHTGTQLPPSPPPVKIYVEKGGAERRIYTFTQPFRAGCDKTCDVRLSDPGVSRFHAEFWFTEGAWWVLDLESANGTYVNGMKVDRSPLARQARVELEAAEQSDPTMAAQFSMTHFQKHYIEGSDDRQVGQHTLMIRRAFKQSQKRQRRTFAAVIAVLAGLALIAGIYALPRFDPT